MGRMYASIALCLLTAMGCQRNNEEEIPPELLALMILPSPCRTMVESYTKTPTSPPRYCRTRENSDGTFQYNCEHSSPDGPLTLYGTYTYTDKTSFVREQDAFGRRNYVSKGNGTVYRDAENRITRIYPDEYTAWDHLGRPAAGTTVQYEAYDPMPGFGVTVPVTYNIQSMDYGGADGIVRANLWIQTPSSMFGFFNGPGQVMYSWDSVRLFLGSANVQSTREICIY